MSAPTNGYTVRLVYYGRADLATRTMGSKENNYSSELVNVSPKVNTQNIRIIAFPTADPESIDQIGIYELVKNPEVEE